MVQSTNAEIDTLAYELYGLTEEKIGIVERRDDASSVTKKPLDTQRLERGWRRCVTQAALGKAEYEMTDTSVCNERSCLSRAVTLSVTSPVM